MEPEDHSWIAYVGLDGRLCAFLHRDSTTGAVLPDDPVERELHLKALVVEREQPPCGGHIGELSGRSGATYPEGQRNPHEPWERVHPLGESGGADVIPLVE